MHNRLHNAIRTLHGLPAGVRQPCLLCKRQCINIRPQQDSLARSILQNSYKSVSPNVLANVEIRRELLQVFRNQLGRFLLLRGELGVRMEMSVQVLIRS